MTDSTRKGTASARGRRAAAEPAAPDRTILAALGGADPVAAIYRRPGFKIRRAHQIALSIFAEECRAFSVTTTQYGVLQALQQYSGRLDQIGMAQLLGLDRSTTGLVVGLLDRRNLLRRDAHPGDRRRVVLRLTSDGERLLVALAPAVERARRRLLEPFSAQEAETFLALLDRLLDHHNTIVRVPLLSPPGDAAGEET